MNDRYKIIDVQTGQIFNLDMFWAQRRLVPKRSFAMLMQEMQFKFSTDPAVSKAELKLYVFLQSVLDYNNRIDYTQAEITRELKMQQSEVSRAIHKLIERGIIEKVHFRGNLATYTMNPQYTQKGKLMKERRHAKAQA